MRELRLHEPAGVRTADECISRFRKRRRDESAGGESTDGASSWELVDHQTRRVRACAPPTETPPPDDDDAAVSVECAVCEPE